jgi:hypothetical protein
MHQIYRRSSLLPYLTSLHHSPLQFSSSSLPQPIYQTRFVDFGKKERILKEIIAYKINYPIHYIKANIEKLHAEAGCHDKTQMLRQNDSIRSGGRLMNYSDFRDSAFETWNLTMVAGS